MNKLQDKYRELMELSKKGDSQGMYTSFNSYVNSLRETLQTRLSQFGEKEKIAKEKQFSDLLSHIEQRKGILAEFEKLFESTISTTTFFLEKSEPQPLSQLPSLKCVFQQMLNICDISVAIVFIGLLKTGKSTIVNTIVGQELSPNREEAMTSIPTRYVHDPTINEPVMFVHFAGALNKVVRKIRQFFNEMPKEKQEESIRSLGNQKIRDLCHLVVNTDFRFKNFYSGSANVYDTSYYIQDFFRLVSNPLFPPHFVEYLPLTWSDGLDSFLTVICNFPGLEDSAANLLNFSIVDTPGVNESGVERLHLDIAVRNIIDSCHYVVFTLLPNDLASEANASLRRKVVDIMHSYSTPTLILATNSDTISHKETLENLKADISTFIGSTDEPYPQEKIFLVSGKRSHLGSLVLRRLAQNQGKPSLDSTDPHEKKLAQEWALFAGHGSDEEEKYSYYNDLEDEDLSQICKKLIVKSGMKMPIEEITTNAVKNGATISTTISIQKTLESLLELERHLSFMLNLQQSSLHDIEKIKTNIDALTKEMAQSMSEISQNIQKKLTAFQENVDYEFKCVINNFKQTDQQIFSEGSFKKDLSESQLKSEIANQIKVIQANFDQAISELLSTKEAELQTLLSDLQTKVYHYVLKKLEEIFQQLGRHESLKVKIDEQVRLPKHHLKPEILSFATSYVKSKRRATTFGDKVGMFFKGEKIEKDKTHYEVQYRQIREYLDFQIVQYSKALQQQVKSRAELTLKEMASTCNFTSLVKIELIKELIKRKGNDDSETQLQSSIENLNEIRKHLVIMLEKVSK